MKQKTLNENIIDERVSIGFQPQASGYMADDLAYGVEISPSIIVNQKVGVIVIGEDTNRKKVL